MVPARELGESAAVLFICRSKDFSKFGEDNLKVARAMDSYAKSHDVLPWDIAYVTEGETIMASELLPLEGLPEFEDCVYKRFPS